MRIPLGFRQRRRLLAAYSAIKIQGGPEFCSIINDVQIVQAANIPPQCTGLTTHFARDDVNSSPKSPCMFYFMSMYVGCCDAEGRLHRKLADAQSS
mmetsp:Transcript_1449/g.4707  ORF Transcript_1449/g.4707 Transcript_1449/m.4707 type:complete len:96 (-) Transcript_1449:1312-1599(-)|eukprot:scaffold231771_cov31-Tisochrysis_lutea.AAC.9